jgi:hypothetical protein
MRPGAAHTGADTIPPSGDDSAVRFMIIFLAAILGATICGLFALVYVLVRLVPN